MSDTRFAGLMLMIGSAGVLVTLGLHPSGHDLFSPATYEAAARNLIAVHSLALASLPFWLLGVMGLSRYLGRHDKSDHLSTAALVFYGFGLAAMLIAVVFDGLVSPGLAGRIISTTDTVAQGWKIAFNYNSMLDMQFLHVMLAAASVGIALWAVAMWRSGSMSRAVAAFGGLLAVFTVVNLATGQIDHNPHLFGVAIVGQAVWFATVGVLLYRIRTVQA